MGLYFSAYSTLEAEEAGGMEIPEPGWKGWWNKSDVLKNGPRAEGQNLPDSCSAEGSPDTQGFIEMTEFESCEGTYLCLFLI